MGVVALWIINAIAVATTTTVVLRLLGVRRGWANDVAEDDRPRAPIRSRPRRPRGAAAPLAGGAVPAFRDTHVRRQFAGRGH